MFTLRHEDLVAAPDEYAQNLCAFLGVEWSSRLDEFLERGFDTGVDPKTVGVWRDDLADKQVATVIDRAGELMQTVGYLDANEASGRRRGSRRFARPSPRLSGTTRAERRPPAAS
jgi:hypothetical protein